MADDTLTLALARAKAVKVDATSMPSVDCPECRGTGQRDSGGMYPWGEYIFVPCDCSMLDSTPPNARHMETLMSEVSSAKRRTIGASNNPALLGGVKAKNNGRYNGNGRDWATPPEVFDPLNAEFQFTLDPCAAPSTAKCARFFTEADDGLKRSWAGERVFMNPPYGKEIYAWTKKAREEAEGGALVVGLLPASTDLAWWHDDIVGHATVRYIRGRVRFLTGGPYRASGFFASVIVVWHLIKATRNG